MRYLLTIVDVFTYFVLIELIPNKEAEITLVVVVRAFYRITTLIYFYYNLENEFAIV